MKNRLLTILVILLCNCKLIKGEACLIGDVYLTTQGQVDSFALLYPACDTIEGNLSIYSEDFQNLDGISGIKVITGRVLVDGHFLTSHIDLTFLQSLGSLSISRTSGVQRISFANDIQLMGFVTSITDNVDLQRIDGLNNISGCDGFFRIERNDNLRMIPRFGGIDTFTGVSIRFCDSLRRIDAFHDVIINTGQTTIARVGALENLTIFSNLQENFHKIELIATSLTLDTFVAFDNLEIAHGSLRISNFNGTASLPSFSNLVRSGQLSITSSSFGAIAGFEKLRVLEDELFLSNLIGVTEFDAFQILDSIGDRFVIQSLESITNISGFDNLRFVNGYFNLASCWNLEALPLFPKLATTRHHIDLVGLRSIKTIDGFNALTEIIDEFINGVAFRLQYNYNLESVTGFKSLQFELLDSLVIADNPLLSMCEAIPICDYLDHGGMSATFVNNAPGCNTVDEVIESCMDVSTEDIKSGQLTVFPNPASSVISFSLGSDGDRRNQVVRIFDILGRMVMNEKTEHGKLDIQTLPEGIYILNLTDNFGNSYSTKIEKI